MPSTKKKFNVKKCLNLLFENALYKRLQIFDFHWIKHHLTIETTSSAYLIQNIYNKSVNKPFCNVLPNWHGHWLDQHLKFCEKILTDLISHIKAFFKYISKISQLLSCTKDKWNSVRSKDTTKQISLQICMQNVSIISIPESKKVKQIVFYVF